MAFSIRNLGKWFRSVWGRIGPSSGTANPAQWLIDWFNDGPYGANDAGVQVNGHTSLSVAAFWQGVNTISGDLLSLPLNIFERTGDTGDREPAREHPAWRLVRRKSNPFMSAGNFKRLLQSHMDVWGNGYAWIERNGRGEPMAMWPLLPDRTFPCITEDGERIYETRVNTNTQGQSGCRQNDGNWETVHILPENMFHVMGLSWDGWSGMSVVKVAKNSLGLAIAQEKHGARFFRNSARPGGLLKFAEGTTPENAQVMADTWNQRHQDVEKAHLTGWMINGDYQTIAQPNDDAQWLESRQFSRADVASWFPLPPHMVNDLEHATFSNIEELNRDYLNRSLSRRLVTWEEECYDKLLTERQKRSESHFFEFNTAALLRGTLLQRYQAYQIGRQGEWLSGNDVRRFENLNSVDGLDDYTNPNVRSPDSPSTGESDDTTDDTESETNDSSNGTMSRAIVSAAIKQKLRNETRRVEAFAEKSRNFCNVVDDFYDRFPVSLLEVIEPIGGTEKDAVDHCEWSRNRIMEIAGEAKPSELLPKIRQEMSNWPSRGERLAEILIERCEDATERQTGKNDSPESNGRNLPV